MISLIDGAIEDFFREEASLSVADISFQIPTKAWSSGLEKAPINLYLFDIRENTELRKNEWETVTRSDSTVTQQKPPARVDLFYMITAYSDKEKNAKIFEEHQLLSRMLAVVHNFAFIPEDPYLIDNLPGISPIPKIPIEAVHPKFLDEQGGFQLWSAIDQFLKPAVYIKVTVPIELHRTVEHQMVLAKVTKYVTVSETFVQLGGIVTERSESSCSEMSQTGPTRSQSMPQVSR